MQAQTTCRSISILSSTVTLQLPVGSEMLPLSNNFALYLMLGMSIFLVVGIVFAFTRKPARDRKVEIMNQPTEKTEEVAASQQVVDIINEPSQDVKEEVIPNLKDVDTICLPSQDVEEEIPQQFDDCKDGIIKLYNWFYRFIQCRFEGITDSMTPREFMGAVLGKISSEGAASLEFLVTVFEFANYSKSKLTNEVFNRTLKAVELLKDLIEGGDMRAHDQDLSHEDSSPVEPANVNHGLSRAQ